MKKDKDTEEMFSIRTINVKLDPTEEQAKLLDKGIQTFSELHDIAVSRYAKLPDSKMTGEEGKNLRRELKSDSCTGTFVDLAIGARGAERYFRTLIKMAKKDIIHCNNVALKLEKENVNLTKPESVWFNPAKSAEGQCSMCGREGKMPYATNEPDINKEYLCEVCAVDFFKYRSELYSLKRYVKKNYFLCKELVSKIELSKGFENIMNKFDKPVEDFKGTISNRFKIKNGQLKMDFDTQIATLTLNDGEKVGIKFVGEHYYTNFPKYGLDSDTNKYRTLVTKFLNEGGYPSLVRKNKDENIFEYYLSIPVHYPSVNRELKPEGVIIVSQRKVMLYINNKIKFVELFNPYFRKRVFERKHKDVQQQNAELSLCHWHLIPKKNRMFLLNLRDKLEYDWMKERNVTVTKSEDDNMVTITDDRDPNNVVKITLDRAVRTAKLIASDGTTHTLHIVSHKKEGKDGVSRYSVTDLYIDQPVSMPNKYSDGNLLNYIEHKNKEVSRHIVEEAKKLLSDKGSVLLLDLTYMHPEGEGIVPMVALNDQIRNMLKYDSIYGGSVYWGRLRILTCPNCHSVQPEKSENRLVIRDILLSKVTSWICESEGCGSKINSPLIAVARHIMSSDIEELLKKPTKKETKKDEKEEELVVT